MKGCESLAIPVLAIFMAYFFFFFLLLILPFCDSQPFRGVLFCFVLFSVCNPGYPVTRYIKPVWPWIHRAPPAPASWVLVLKAHATILATHDKGAVHTSLWGVAPAGGSGQTSARISASFHWPIWTLLSSSTIWRVGVIIIRTSYDYYNGNDLIDLKPLAVFLIVYSSANGN